jgi:lipid-binding SYLF domain-containing protein
VRRNASKIFLCLAVFAAVPLFATHEAVERIGRATEVFNEIMAAPDKGIPTDLLEGAKCIGIIPGMKKGGFIVGANYGKGVVVCRTATGWSGPSTVRIEGGSIGAQIGGGEVDVVLAVMNDEGARKLMREEFTLGADAGVMAGPVGRTAEAKTNPTMSAGILSWSRSRGLFAGVSLNGATLRDDKKDNEAIYGKAVRHEDILTGKVPAPAAAQPLYNALNKYSGKTVSKADHPAHIHRSSR